MLPLRIVPLRVLDAYKPVESRVNNEFRDMLNGQYDAIEIWKKELMKRFTTEQLSKPITEINLKKY
jgi:hypothetical protein